jgi:hypothetical protein
MNAARRARQAHNHRLAGGHSVLDHVVLAFRAQEAAREAGKRTELAVNCPVCRPRPRTWDRSMAGKAIDG